MSAAAYCPHCHRMLAQRAPHPYPARSVRCPHCRLLVGPGRAQDADRRPRKSGARFADAPSVDTVRDVLREMHRTPYDADAYGRNPIDS